MHGNLKKENPLSLYFHIPFCSKKCPYCHFYVIKHTQELETAFVSALCKEIKQNALKIQNRPIPSLYFGGGTPSKLSLSSFEKILKTLKDLDLLVEKEAEITLEANPEDLNFAYLSSLKDLGFNRISIGVQSLETSSLAMIKREHKVRETIEGINTAHQAGFSNITIDLMYDLPNQTLSQFQKTLSRLKELPISHVSLYNLTVEPNSAYFRQKEKILKSQPKDEESSAMLKEAISSLESLGLKRYEISAFAKEGCESVHNTGYWTGREFIGFGPSAFSLFEQRRFQNVCNIMKYFSFIENNKTPVDFEEALSKEDFIKEAFCVRLRMLEGIRLEQFPPLPKDLALGLEKKIQEGLIIKEKDRVFLSQEGLLFYDDIAADLI